VLANVVRNINSTIRATVAAISFHGIFGNDQYWLAAMGLIKNLQRNLVMQQHCSISPNISQIVITMLLGSIGVVLADIGTITKDSVICSKFHF
jgi:hypothetical protein